MLRVFVGVSFGPQAGMMALAVAMYPPGHRRRLGGLFGRLDSVVDPTVGGAVISAHTSASTIGLVICAPLIVAVLVVAALDARNRRTPGMKAVAGQPSSLSAESVAGVVFQ